MKISDYLNLMFSDKCCKICVHCKIVDTVLRCQCKIKAQTVLDALLHHNPKICKNFEEKTIS